MVKEHKTFIQECKLLFCWSPDEYLTDERKIPVVAMYLKEDPSEARD